MSACPKDELCLAPILPMVLRLRSPNRLTKPLTTAGVLVQRLSYHSGLLTMRARRVSSPPVPSAGVSFSPRFRTQPFATWSNG